MMMTLHYLWAFVLGTQANLSANPHALMVFTNSCAYLLSPFNGAQVLSPLCYPKIDDVLPLNDSFLILANGFIYKVENGKVEERTFVGYGYKYLVWNGTAIVCGIGCKDERGTLILNENVTARPYIYRNYILFVTNGTLEVVEKGNVINKTFVGEVREAWGCGKWLYLSVNNTIVGIDLERLPRLQIMFTTNGTLFSVSYDCKYLAVWDNGTLRIYDNFNEIVEEKITNVSSLALINGTIFVSFGNGTVVAYTIGYKVNPGTPMYVFATVVVAPLLRRLGKKLAFT